MLYSISIVFPHKCRMYLSRIFHSKSDSFVYLKLVMSSSLYCIGSGTTLWYVSPIPNCDSISLV